MRSHAGRRRAIAAALAAVLALVLAPAALAHPYLVAASPQGGVVATTTPTRIQLAFTEGLVIRGCAITLTTAGGRHVPVGPVTPALGATAMSARVAHLGEGIYTVHWVAYGNDGHTVAGAFQFGVPSASGQAPPGAARLLATTTASAESAPTESLLSVAARWLAVLAAFALLGGAALFARLRGRIDQDLHAAASAKWQRLIPFTFGVALLGTVVEAIQRADGPHGLSLSLLTSATSGVAILVRLAVLVVGTVMAQNRPRRLTISGVAGALALAALAVDGHVATVHETPALATAAQILHLLAGGVWIGAALVIAATLAPTGPRNVRAATAAHAPVAIAAAAVMIVTGVVAAVREVGRWYFLRWSSYGHILTIKVLVVAGIVGLGAAAAFAGRKLGERRASLMRAEALLAVAATALAALLAGTLQGRGQTLPSQRGNLLPGAGFADVALTHATGQLTLAPARVGVNRIIVANVAPNQSGSPVPPVPRSVAVRIACSCGGRPLSLRVPLHPGAAGPSGAWAADVALPLNGTYSAQLIEDGRPTIGSPTFTVGDSSTPGSTPLTVAAVADLSGPDAVDCRSQEYGALLSLELMNAAGGVGGTKLRQVVLDDEGSPALARAEALRLAADHPVAFLAPCGPAARAAVAAVGDRIPTIVADDSVPVTAGRRVFRLAPDPYAEGYAAGQYIGRIGIASSPNVRHRVAALTTAAPDSRARLQGLRAALSRYGVSVDSQSASGPGLAARIERVLPAAHWLGIYVDGNFAALTSALRQAGAATEGRINPAPIIVSQRLASERFVVASGQLGLQGQVRAVTDVDPTNRDAPLYGELVGQVVGELATVPGLSGFVAGQALAYGMTHGASPDAITTRLRAPGVFSHIATSPWDDRDPAQGTLIFRMLLAQFLPDNLIPAGGGAPSEPYEGQFFANGAWEPASPELFSPLALGNKVN